jgi:hypothetical protein
MKIYKISGVEDFMGGVKDYDISQMPEEDQLTNEQKSKIRSDTLNLNDSFKRLQYFLRYPNTAYMSLYDIEKCFSWGANQNDLKNALELWLKNPENTIRYSIAYGLPEWAYDTIIKYFSPLKISHEAVGDILSNEDKFPINFVNFFKSKYSDIANGIQDTSKENKINLIKNYIEFPSEKNITILTNIQNKSELDMSNPNRYLFKDQSKRSMSFEIKRYLMNSSVMWDDISRIVKNKSDNYWDLLSTEMLDELMLIKQHYEEGRFFYKEDNPFIIAISNHTWGQTKTIFLGNKIVSANIIQNIINVLGNVNSNHYCELNWGNSSALRYKVDIDEDLELPDSIYLINAQENKYYDIADNGRLIANLNNDSYRYDSFYIDELRKATHTTTKEDSDIFNNWINDILSNKKLTNEQYLKLVESSAVKSITEKAGSDLYSSKVNNHEVLNEDDYDPNEQISWRETWPFTMKAAFNLWEKIPINVRAATSDNACTWFVYFSGLFPCDSVYKRAQKYIRETQKILDYIECSGDSKVLREKLKTELDIKEKDIENKIMDKMPEFLKSDAVKKYKLSDFPDVFEYAKQMLKSNIEDEMTYDYKSQSEKSKIDIVTKEISETNIYLIDEYVYTQFLGEDGVNYFSGSPKEVNGFFIQGRSVFGDNSSIIIFTDKIQSNTTSEMILNELGINASSTNMSLSEENTLWHEVSHAFLDKFVYGRIDKEYETGNTSQWLKSPQEISAITYGNLQHIKRKIKQYFEYIYPFPERITQGLINQIKFDIIETFAWEFQGMEKQQALMNIQNTMPEFNDEVLDAMNSMSKEEQINMMTNMFTEFFMRKMMRSKVEDELTSQFKNMGEDINKVNFQEKVIIPEDDNFSQSTYSEDEFIKELSKRNYYQEFLKKCNEIIKNAYNNFDLEYFISMYRPYVLKNNPQKLHPVFKLEDLLLLMFGQPATIGSANIESVNPIFSEAIPPQLLLDVKEIVKRQRKLLSNTVNTNKETPISPDEAEEAGQFIAEMDQDYGPDWMWVAKNKANIKLSKNNWYKICLLFNKIIK